MFTNKPSFKVIKGGNFCTPLSQKFPKRIKILGAQIVEKKQISQNQKQEIIRDDRKYRTVIEPTESRETQLEKINDRVWYGIQPFSNPSDKKNSEVGNSRGIKMVLYKFKDGSILVHNPIAPTEECVKLVKENIRGEIKYIVIGSTTKEHTYFSQDFCEKICPEANVWVIPSLYHQITSGKNPHYNQLIKKNKLFIISDKQNWGDNEVQTKLLQSMIFFNEALFFLKDEKIILTTDLIAGIRKKEKETLIFSLFLDIKSENLSPIVGRLAWIITAIFQLSLEPREKVINFFSDVGQWDFEHIIPAHGNLFMDIGKKYYIKMMKNYFGVDIVQYN